MHNLCCRVINWNLRAPISVHFPLTWLTPLPRLCSVVCDGAGSSGSHFLNSTPFCCGDVKVGFESWDAPWTFLPFFWCNTHYFLWVEFKYERIYWSFCIKIRTWTFLLISGQRMDHRSKQRITWFSVIATYTQAATNEGFESRPSQNMIQP